MCSIFPLRIVMIANERGGFPVTMAEFQLYQEQTFDSYAKRLIRNESIDARRELARRTEREVSLSALPYDDLPAAAHEDKYFLETLDIHSRAGEVEVLDHLLGQAIMSLAPKWRDVIVMYYFMDMTDEKIGGILQLTTGAIRRRRQTALERLKTMLEDMGYER